MPVYEYRCSKCDKTFEMMRKFSDPPLTTHEECGGAVEQLISAPAFQLKGTGWYVTDYAKTGANKPGSGAEGKPEASKDSDSKASGSKDGESKDSDKKPAEKSTETKTESKPAASAPAKSDS